MENVLLFKPQPRVLHTGFIRQLSEANRALRQLRGLGCRVLSQTVTARGSEIVIDHNPHRTLTGCPSVHVTCGKAA